MDFKKGCYIWKKIAELEIEDSRNKSEMQSLKQEANVCMTKLKD